MVSYNYNHRGNATTISRCCCYYYGSLCIVLLLVTNRANNNSNNIYCYGFGGANLYKNNQHHHRTYSFINKNINYQESTTRTRRISYQPIQFDNRKTILFSISDWRDTIFDIKKDDIDNTSETDKLSELDVLSVKEICILPFDFTDVLVQGETKQLRLYEERFIQLFADVKNNYNNVVAMGILADYGIVQIVPICEIEAYTDNISSNLGIFVTIRIVGRAKLLDIIQQTPYIKATCMEVFDIIPSNLELPNLIANNIDDLMLLLSSMEYRLEKSKEEATIDSQNYSNTTSTTSTTNEPIQKIEIDRKLRMRKLEDTFYDDNYDDDDDEEDDDDDDDGIRIDRLKRYKRAYEIALETDTQGYQVVSTTTTAATTTDKNVSSSSTTTTIPATTSLLLRNARELTAISWAAFCSDLVPTIDSIKLRILAVNSKSLIDRLSIALRLLRLKKISIQKQLKDAGLEYKNTDIDSSIDSITDIIDDEDDDDDDDDKNKKL